PEEAPLSLANRIIRQHNEAGLHQVEIAQLITACASRFCIVSSRIQDPWEGPLAARGHVEVGSHPDVPQPLEHGVLHSVPTPLEALRDVRIEGTTLREAVHHLQDTLPHP